MTGKLKKEHLKRNDTAKEGSVLYLTKPLGIGIVTTAQKKGIVSEAHLKKAVETMLTLNKLGGDFGKLSYVNAMTDVTGFGLLGHLIEVCEGSGLSAEIEFTKVPKFDFLDTYIQQKSMPGGILSIGQPRMAMATTSSMLKNPPALRFLIDLTTARPPR